jgi:hypothetical protein
MNGRCSLSVVILVLTGAVLAPPFASAEERPVIASLVAETLSPRA